MPNSSDFENDLLLKRDDGNGYNHGRNEDQTPSRGSRRWHVTPRTDCSLLLIISLLCLSITISTFTAATIVMRQKSTIPKVIYEDCGTTPAEAKAAGCIFDMMNYAWTHPSCYDSTLSTPSLALGPWKWYLDPNATQPVPQETLSLGQEMNVWVEDYFHIVHCLYAFKIHHKAATTGQLVPNNFASWNHTLHCEKKLLLGGAPMKGMGNSWKTSTTIMMFNHCTKLEDGGVY